MAFSIRGLENHAGSGGGIKLWSYRTTADNKAAVKGAGYFNQAYDLLNVGDRIAIESTDAGFDARVSAKSAGVITIAAVGTFA